MASRGASPRVQYLALAELLQTIAYPVRLELLDQLRLPHAVGDLEVTPYRQRSDASADRPLARETVREHVKKMVDVGLLTEHEVRDGGQPVKHYQVDPSKLYELVEDLRRVCTLYRGRGPAEAATVTEETVRSAGIDEVDGPCLVLVHGVFVGTVFPLDAARAEGDEPVWRIGRDDQAPVSVPHDSYVSSVNSFIRQVDDAFVVEDAEESKNGTLVNWEPLAPGEQRELECGDIIGVGRSLLCFRPD